MKPNPLLRWPLWLLPTFVSFCLIIVEQYSFVTFHTLIELFTVIISFTIFSLAWATKDVSKNNFLLFLACGYLWIGSLDLIHALVFIDMNAIVDGTGNLTTQFWIVARYFESLLLFSAPFFVSKNLNAKLLVTLFAIPAIAFSVSIFQGSFATTYITGQGLTQFKIYSEYAIVFILLLAQLNLHRIRVQLSAREYYLVTAAIIFSIAAELMFTQYIDMTELAFLLGHIFKFFSFWFIYNAMVIENIQVPYSELRKKEDIYKRLFENSEVSIWDEDYSQVFKILTELRRQGITDLKRFLENDEQLLWKIAAMVKVKRVNEATLKLFNAKNDAEFHRCIGDTFADNSINVFLESLNAIWRKDKSFTAEAIYWTLDKRKISCILSFQIPKTKEGFRSIPITLVDITARKVNERKVMQQANFDDLTGLVNRNLFFDRLRYAITSAQRNITRVALLYIDVDGIKLINETLGHKAGDELLQGAAQRLVNHMRKSDTVARLGGDEFAIILPENNSNHDIENTVNKIHANLSRPFPVQGRNSVLSASIGIAIYPDDGNNSATLLRKADSAMYQAKIKGRNNFQFFTQEIDVEATRRRELEEELHSALINGEFILNYQPVINIKTGLIDSAEALIRWQHPQKGLVSPFEFIPLAEDIGLIVPIGEWVLREACREAMNWVGIKEYAPSVAVNLSSRQFQHQDIPELVESVLAETGLPANRLILEITESLLLFDNVQLFNQLQIIRNLGVHLSIDDFGTGYSSLSYLKKFPVTILKIDRSFIMNLTTVAEDRSLVNTILAMAENFNLEVVAEGVETEDQATFLKATNCNYIQGYLYSKPLTNKGFVKYLINHQVE